MTRDGSTSNDHEHSNSLSSNSKDWQVKFLADVAAVKRVGLEAGLKETDVDKALETAFGGSKELQDDNVITSTRTFLRNGIEVATKLTHFLTLLLCVAILISQTNCIERWVNKNLFPSYYPALSLARRFSIWTGLRDYLATYRLYDENCLVENPLYEPISINECQFCIKSKILEYKEKEIFPSFVAKDFEEQSDVMIFRGAVSNLTIDEIQNVFESDTQEANTHSRSFICNLNTVKSAEAFLAGSDLAYLFSSDEITPTPFLIWRVDSVNISRHFRQLVPRAPFLPPEAEVQLDKTFFVYNARMGKFKILVGNNENNWIYQARGSRCFELKAQDPECHLDSDSLCPTHFIQLNGGDFLYLNGHIWTIFSKPCSFLSKNSYAISYHGSFQIQ